MRRRVVPQLAKPVLSADDGPPQKNPTTERASKTEKANELQSALDTKSRTMWPATLPQEEPELELDADDLDRDTSALVQDDDYLETETIDGWSQLEAHDGYLASASEQSCFTDVVLDQEDEERVKSFQQKVRNIIHCLKEEAHKTSFEDITAGRGWMILPFWFCLRRSSARAVSDLFLFLTSKVTQAILGHEHITSEHILSLAKPGREHYGLKGVYLDCAIRRQCRQLDETLAQTNEKLGLEGPATCQTQNNALYTGSSTLGVAERILDHIKWVGYNTTENPGNRPYHHRMIQQNDLEPSFRVVGTFPKSVRELGLECADCGWLPRLFETVLMILTDSYLPADPDSPRARYGVVEAEWARALKECGIQRSKFLPLNKALSTKQPIRDPVARECRNCKTKETCSWYYDVFPEEEEDQDHGAPIHLMVTQYLCRACYAYRRRVKCDRPLVMPSSLRGPCSNCKVDASKKWLQHPALLNQVLCKACHSYLQQHNNERPRKYWVDSKTERVCLSCQTTKTSRWYHARDASGNATDDWWCGSCYDKFKDRFICHICHTRDSPNWPTHRTCENCYKKRSPRNDNDLKRERDRSDCSNCLEKFVETRKFWCLLTNLWYCLSCYKCLQRHQQHRVHARHLEGLEIRCEACKALWANSWVASRNEEQPGETPPGRILCGRCTCRIRKARKDQRPPSFPDNSSIVRKSGDQTFQSWYGAQKRHVNNEVLVKYLEQIHNLIFVVENSVELRPKAEVQLRNAQST